MDSWEERGGWSWEERGGRSGMGGAGWEERSGGGSGDVSSRDEFGLNSMKRICTVFKTGCKNVAGRPITNDFIQRSGSRNCLIMIAIFAVRRRPMAASDLLYDIGNTYAFVSANNQTRESFRIMHHTPRQIYQPKNQKRKTKSISPQGKNKKVSWQKMKQIIRNYMKTLQSAVPLPLALISQN